MRNPTERDYLDSLIDDVIIEYECQVNNYGVGPKDPRTMLAVLVEEVGEVARIINEAYPETELSAESRDKIVVELIQVAAVAVNFALQQENRS